MDTTMRDADDAEAENEEDNNNEPDMDADADADAAQDAESSTSNTDQVSEAVGGPAAAGEGPSRPNTDAPPTMSPRPANTQTSSASEFYPAVRPECLTATTYDIVPTTAAPQSTSINAITATADMRWVFSGGSDGYVRKFNWVETVNGKSMLTVAQRHPFVDSVVKAGYMMSYWENKDGNALSPVYSLACQSEGLWILTGLESGCIRVQSVRHEEGREITTLEQHRSAISVLSLSSDEKSSLSGSWDKRVLDWDLNTGQVRRSFGGSAAQISAVEFRPESSVPIPRDTLEPPPLTNGTYSSNYKASGSGLADGGGDSQGDLGALPSPAGSLFSSGSLFGDGDVSGGIGDGTGTSSDTLTNGVGFNADAHETGRVNGMGASYDTNEKTEPEILPNGVSSEPAFARRVGNGLAAATRHLPTRRTKHV